MSDHTFWVWGPEGSIWSGPSQAAQLVKNRMDRGGSYVRELRGEALRTRVDGDEVEWIVKELSRHGILVPGTPNSTVQVENCTFHLHPPGKDSSISSTLACGLPYKEVDTIVFRSFLRKGDFLVDVGANIGWYSLLCSETVGPEGRVLAFEPDPDNFALLKKGVASSGLRNVECLNSGLGSGTRWSKFYRKSGLDVNCGDVREWDEGGWEYIGSRWVEPLDLILTSDEQPVNAIKLDTQGSEMDVLLGARKTIERSPNVVMLLELWPEGLKHHGRTVGDLDTLLKELKFNTFYGISQMTGSLNLLHAGLRLDGLLCDRDDWVVSLLCLKG